MKKILMVICMLSLFLLVSCGTEEVVEDNVKKAVEVKEIASVQATGEIYQVVIENNQFMPVDLEVKVGDTVEWINTDYSSEIANPKTETEEQDLLEEGIKHTITFENGDFDGELPVGATGTYTFTETGEYRYFCQFHPGMQGSVIVN